MEATVAAIEPGRLAGTAAVPPSKSAAHRAVVCAALAAGTSHIGNVEFSQDILATLGAAQQLGAKVERGEHELTITGRGNADGPHQPARCSATKAAAHCGLSCRCSA